MDDFAAMMMKPLISTSRDRFPPRDGPATCWACAERLAPGAKRCRTCGERTDAGNDALGWDGETLELHLGGQVPATGCVGCGKADVSLPTRTFVSTPARAYLLGLPFLVLGPLVYLLATSLMNRKATVVVPTCVWCRLREHAVNVGLFVAALGLFMVLPWVGLALGHRAGLVIGLGLCSAFAIVAKAFISPRNAPVRLRGMDDRSVLLSFRHPAAITA